MLFFKFIVIINQVNTNIMGFLRFIHGESKACG